MMMKKVLIKRVDGGYIVQCGLGQPVPQMYVRQCLADALAIVSDYYLLELIAQPTEVDEVDDND
jgi:hypothetical protein